MIGASMDLNLQDAAEIQQDEEDHDGGGDEGDTADSEEEVEVEAQPKRRRGKDLLWKHFASFSSNDLYKDSEIFTELKSQMSRKRITKEGNSRIEWFYCLYANKRGYKKCPKVYKVAFPQTSYEVFVYSTDDDHFHEEDDTHQTKTNYRWTEAQEAVIRRCIKTNVTRNKLIVRELRESNLVNASGCLPSADQVHFFSSPYSSCGIPLPHKSFQ